MEYIKNAFNYVLDQVTRHPWYATLVMFILALLLGISIVFGEEKHSKEELFQFAVEYSGLKDPGTRPKVILTDHDWLNDWYYEGRNNAGDVLAVYQNGIIRVSNKLPEENYPEFFVHEFVHHLQHENGLEYECTAEAEKVAYEAQIRFVEEQKGGDGMVPNGLFMFMLTCKDIH